jgi:hypothetical protein
VTAISAVDKKEEDTMGSKWIVISVITAMAAVVMFASTAAAIVVDGNGSDWDPSWFLASDPLPDTHPIFGYSIYCGNAGYNLTGVWQHYNATENKLYFMYNLTGIAGDSDGNLNPNTATPPGWDQYGVGRREGYVLMINTSPTGDPSFSMDVQVELNNNSVIVTGPKGPGGIKQQFSNCHRTKSTSGRSG